MPSTQLTTIQLINENVFEWSVALIVLNEDSLYYGGYFKAKMTFPRNYPHSPPGTSQHMSGVEPQTMTPRWCEDNIY
jgi:ubiquitin-protein ligase